MLQIRDLSISFTMYDVGLRQRQVTPITQLDLDVQAGELIAVIGASGSGKSLLAHAVLGILPHNATVTGDMIYQGTPLTPEQQRQWRGSEIALIPQSVASLDPLQAVGAQVQRAAVLSGIPREQARDAQKGAFERYQLGAQVSKLLPHQISGGMARRVLLATATIGNANLLIADEPTPGLHQDVVEETLQHLRELADRGKGVILITHDIEAALTVSDKIAVFYAGTTVETALASDFADDGEALRHPYTKALWRALPRNGFQPLPGVQPNPDALPTGCLFADRCPIVTPECHEGRPENRALRDGFVRCIHA
ncbi:MAG: ABC transporter ATP-binding protein [Chloroflexota bacterium]